MNIIKTQILKYLESFNSSPIDIRNFSLGSLELHVGACVGAASAAQLEVSNDQDNWDTGTTGSINIVASALPAKYYTQISSVDLSYSYIRIAYTHVGPLTTFECVQKIIAKTV